eukprot:scaffold379108_cov24-Attheya_sp.AAC.1
MQGIPQELVVGTATGTRLGTRTIVAATTRGGVGSSTSLEQDVGRGATDPQRRRHERPQDPMIVIFHPGCCPFLSWTNPNLARLVIRDT